MDFIMFCVVLLLVRLVYYSEAGIQFSGSTISVKQVKSLVCSSEVNLSRYSGWMVAYHKWYQFYDAETDHSITNLRPIEALNTKLTIELEKFDNNTDIFSSLSVYNASNGYQHVFNLSIHCSGVERKLISLLDDGYYECRIDKVLNYVVTKSVSISCQEYSHLSDSIQIGWINTVTNRIFVYNDVQTEMKLSAEHNGSILCCIYYTVTADNNGKNIRRFVKNKTLLILQEEMLNSEEPSATTTKSSYENSNIPEASNARNSNATKEMGKYSNTTDETHKNSNDAKETNKTSNAAKETSTLSSATNKSAINSNATNELGKNSNSTNKTSKTSNAPKKTGKNSNATNGMGKNSNATDITDSSDHDAVTSNNFTIWTSSISASVLVLLVVIYAINKRRRRKVNRGKRSQQPLPSIPRQQSPNEADLNSPFYVNLLFRRECQREIQLREEPQYEEVMYQ